MTREEVYTKLNKIFQEVFDDETVSVNDTTTSNDIEDWDSLKQVMLISEIEDVFNIEFESSEVFDVQNVGEMVDIIIDKK